MKIQAKTSLIVTAALLASGLLAIELFRRVVLVQFERLEESQVIENVSRVEDAFQQQLDGLMSRGKDWAMWDDAYKFVREPAPSFIKQNLSYQILSPLDFDHVVFLNHNLELVYGLQIDTTKEEASTLSGVDVAKIIDAKHLSEALSTNTAFGAFIRAGEHAYILSATPVTDSAGLAKPAGIFFITRKISEDFVQQISRVTKVSLAAADLTGQPTAATSQTRPKSPDSFFRHPLIKHVGHIAGSTEILDMNGSAILKLTARFGRDVYNKGVRAGYFFTAIIAATSILAGALVIFLMRAFVLHPVKKLVAALGQITLHSDFSRRMMLSSRDELGTLANQINSTLQALEETISKAENAQRRAEHANAAKSSFIAKVSHELRTPIHSITGMLRILLKEERSSGKRSYIMMARNSAYGLLETINEILDFSKAEAGKLVLESIEFSIHDVIRDSLQTVGPRIEEKGSLEAVVEISQGIPEKLLGDPLRLKQVLVNLLGNATKFTKEGHLGLKTAIAHSSANRVTIEINIFDTGVGIPEDRIEHIFEPFGQADESVSRMFTGTGLGLTIVKQFVETMGGRVKVESKLNVGSQFILTIPFDIPEHSQQLIHRPVLATQRVAVVDGNSIVAESLSHGLEDMGYIPDIIMSNNPMELEQFSRSINEYGLVIVTSEALKRSRVFDLVIQLRGRESIPVVSILSPFEISVRERLIALEVPFVMTRPTSLFDILGVIDGKISVSSDAWEDAEDFSLQTGRPLEVLIADDAQTNRIILTELLRDAGHHVMCVENGEDLVARVRDSMDQVPGMPKFDIVLTDVQMPLLDGLTATARIRALERNSGARTALPIVAVTAHAMTDEINRMRQFGVDDIATKPLDPIKLGEIIQRLTGKAQSQTDLPSRSVPKTEIAAEDLCESGLRLWTQLAQRSPELAELFSLSDEPASPEDFQRVLDIADVIERSGDSVRRTMLIFRSFLDCFREQLHKLHEAKNAKQLEELRFASHALKGLLLDIGARVSANLASSIEQMSKEGLGEEAFAPVGKLTKQILLVARLVTQLCEAGGATEGSHENTNVAEVVELPNTDE